MSLWVSLFRVPSGPLSGALSNPLSGAPSEPPTPTLPPWQPKVYWLSLAKWSASGCELWYSTICSPPGIVSMTGWNTCSNLLHSCCRRHQNAQNATWCDMCHQQMTHGIPWVYYGLFSRLCFAICPVEDCCAASRLAIRCPLQTHCNVQWARRVPLAVALEGTFCNPAWQEQHFGHIFPSPKPSWHAMAAMAEAAELKLAIGTLNFSAEPHMGRRNPIF